MIRRRRRGVRWAPLQGMAGAGLAVLALAAPVAAAAQEAAAPRAPALGIVEALERARSENERVRAAEAAVERARAERTVARGRRLPEVNLAGRSTRIDAPIAIDLEPIRQAMLALHPQVPAQALPPFVEEVQGERFSNLTLSGTLPLFTGGRLQAGVTAAGAAVRAAEQERRSALGEVSTELVRRYYGVRLAAESREVRAQSLATLRRHVEDARRLERNGLIARAERLRAEVAEAEAERELDAARREEELAARALGSTLGLDGAAHAATPLAPLPALPPVDSFTVAAMQRNPQLLRLAAERERAHQATRAERGQFLPQVALFGQRELYTQDLTLLQPTWAVGVAVSLPLFQGGQRVGRVNAAAALERELALREERARRDVRLLVESRYRELSDARSRLAALEKARELAEESLRAQRRAFEAGLATSLDVVDAELALARVQLGRIKALYDFDVALAELLQASGQSERLEGYLAGTDAGEGHPPGA